MSKMLKEEVFSKVQAIIAEEADVEKNDIHLDSSLVNDIGLSSMDIMNMVSDFEKTFSVKIPEKMLRTFANVQDIVDCIWMKIEG